MKLITVGKEQRIVGLHIIGPMADEMIQGFAVAVRMGCTMRDLHACVAIHPTMAEEAITIKWGMDGTGKNVTLPPYLDHEVRPLSTIPKAMLVGAAVALGFIAGRLSRRV